jgi:CRISPR/Cas system CSM-associated protein Csm3 (group 7 of RAMP superfamily)
MEHIYIWKFDIVTQSPLHIGDNDQSVLLDKDGTPLLPGTSLTGACRAYVEQIYNESVAQRLFGASGSERTPSRLFISDGICKTTQPTYVRTGITIDKKSRTVEESKLFQRTALTPGVVFEVTVQLRTTPEDHAHDREVVEDILNALHHGFIRIGAYKSIGGGKVSLSNGRFVHYDFTDEKDLFAFIDLTKPFVPWSPNDKLFNSSQVELTITGKTASPLLIAGDYLYDHQSPDRTHIRLNNGNMSCGIIPASSLKGVLRHCVTRIVHGLNLKDKTTPLIKLFGADKDANEKCSGNLLLEDIMLEQEMRKEYYRIGINPLTGGVKDGALLNEETVLGCFRTQCIYCYSSNADPHEEIDDDRVALALLVFAWRDFALKRMTLGSGRSIGRGYLDIDTIDMLEGKRRLHIDFNQKKIVDPTNWLEELQRAIEAVT